VGGDGSSAGAPACHDGVLQGAIQEDGVFTPVITVKDSSKPANGAAQRYTIMVKPSALSVPLAAISPRTLGSGWVGGEYAEALLASGGKAPFYWTIESGMLPRGLVLSAQSGEIRGIGRREAAGFLQRQGDGRGGGGSHLAARDND